MRKIRHILVIVVVALLALIVGVLVANSVGLIGGSKTGALTKGRIKKKTFLIDKPGFGKQKVEFYKYEPPSVEPPPQYDPRKREWKGSSSDQEVVKRITKEALNLDWESTVSTNKGRQGEIKRKLADYFDDSAGELTKKKEALDNALNINDITVIEARISRFDFKGISIEGDRATVVVDMYPFEKIRYKGSDNEDIVRENKGGEQHTIELVKKDNHWLIKSDRFVIIPGYEP